MKSILRLSAFIGLMFFSLSGFAAEQACEDHLKEVAAAISRLSAEAFSVAELYAGSFSVTAPTEFQQISYVMLTGEQCEILKVCRGGKTDTESCYDEE